MLKIILLGLLGLGLFIVWGAKEGQLNWLNPERVVSERDIPRDEIDPLTTLANLALRPDAPEERLTFSNTMTLGPEFATALDDPLPLLGSAEPRMSLPAFPANTSERTRAELELLHQYAKLRTPERLQAIQSELEMSGVKIGPEVLSVYLSDPRYVATGRLLTLLFDEIEPIVLRQKVRFDRVRPHKLDPTLTTAIEVPAHPAYPSGHATQAFAIAFLLSQLDPEHGSDFERDALGVAINREIAGVHYPSDSAAGKILARQIVDAFLQVPPIVTLLEQAKREWLSVAP